MEVTDFTPFLPWKLEPKGDSFPMEKEEVDAGRGNLLPEKFCSC